MGYVLGCLMAAVSFLLNRILVRHIGLKSMISYGPLLEETTKTIPAFFLGADILVVHITFGVIEAGYDWQQNARTGAKAALFSIGGHCLFGMITVFLVTFSGSIWLALAAALAVHLAWNVSIIKIYS